MDKIVILASGEGTNAEQIMKYFDKSDLAKVVLVVSNKSEAGVLARAKRWGIPTKVLLKDDFSNGMLQSLLGEVGADWIILAGFLLKVPDTIVAAYPQRILNIHPALLPHYGGKGMYGDRVHAAVLAAGEKESGITIHYIDTHYDRGQTIFQARCEVRPDDTVHSLAERVHQLEHAHFPRVIADEIRKAGLS